MKKQNKFSNKKVYLSAAIRGKVNTPPEFILKLIRFIQENGAVVLDEHVGYENVKERYDIFSKNTKHFLNLSGGKEKNYRKADMKWVDEATHFIALVDGPSLGVGMEIERALLKPERQLPITPILCLIHEENLPYLSAMVLGIENKQFYLKTYRTLEDAKKQIQQFLLS